MAYYRITYKDMGDFAVIEPQGCYEKIGNDGDLVVRWAAGDVPLFPKSDIKETCFAREPHLCLFSIAGFLQEGWYYLYKTKEAPDIDLENSKWRHTLDCAFTKEVRFRKPVQVKRIQTFYLSKEDIRYIQALHQQFFHSETSLFCVPKNHEQLMEQFKEYLQMAKSKKCKVERK